MTLSTSNLYILATWCQWTGISGDTDTVYTDKEEAQAACDRRNAQPAYLGVNITYSVISLDEYIDEVKSNARSEGREQERDSQIDY